MDFSNYYMLLDLAIFFYGIYGLIGWLKLVRAGKLIDNRLICPGGVKAADCIAPDEYYKKVKPRIFYFSLINTFCGAFNIFCNLNPNIFPSYYTYTVIIVFLSSIVLFGFTIAKISQKYWC